MAGALCARYQDILYSPWHPFSPIQSLRSVRRPLRTTRTGRYSVIRSYDQLPTQHVHSASKDEFPSFSGVSSIGVVLNGGKSRAIPKSPKITFSLQDAVSSR